MNGIDRAARGKVLIGGAIGNFVEWYDFALYGYFATTIAHLFFPKEDPTGALLSTFAILAVSFAARPIGGVAFGYLGDRWGRRTALLWSVLLMSAGTVGIGLLPGDAQIGAFAPALLLVCRLVQGFAAGGEWASATIFVIEHAPVGRRGRYASVSPLSNYVGGAFGALVSMAITATTTPEQLASWGWRLPFILALPLALFGLYLRLRVEDSPVFTALQSDGNVESFPLVQAFRVAKKPMFVLMGWVMASSVAYYLMVTFLVSYLGTTRAFSYTASLVVQLVFTFGAAACCLLAGLVVDRLGLKRVAVTAALCLGFWAVPAFILLQRSPLVGACLTVAVFAVLSGGINVTTALLLELFPASVRSSASGLTFNLAYAVFGGTAPYLATWFVGAGHLIAPGYYLAGLCVIAALAVTIGIGGRAAVDHGNEITQSPVSGPMEAV